MRLTQTEIDVIVKAAKKNFGESIRLYLFGSRVDDARRGGDVDIYVESDRKIENPLDKTLGMSADIQLELGEQKIDILVWDPTMERKRIFDIARETGVELHHAA